MAIRDRQQQVLKHVNAVGVASIRDLARLHNVSEMTIRRDIDHLASARLLKKLPGGAERLEDRSKFHEAHLRVRMKINVAAKRRLAEAAARIVDPGDTIFIDGSTTMIMLAQELAKRDPEITVLTNSLLVALDLADTKNMQLICVGGIFERDTLTFCPVGDQDSLTEHHVNKAFMSCTGLRINEGTWDNSVLNVQLKRTVAKHSERVYLVIDASKFGRRALNRVLDTEDIDVVVTDGELPREDISALAAKGVNVNRV